MKARRSSAADAAEVDTAPVSAARIDDAARHLSTADAPCCKSSVDFIRTLLEQIGDVDERLARWDRGIEQRIAEPRQVGLFSEVRE